MPGSSFPLPKNESERVLALSRYNLLDTPPEPLFDTVAQLAALICDVPMAAVSLIDEHRQWFKAKVGFDLPETPRSISFCAHTITSRELMVVPDASLDLRFRDNPLVTSAPGVRFYAGMPLVTPAGFAIGTIAVLDTRPGDLSENRRRMLKILAEHVIDHIELTQRGQDSMQALKAIVYACPLAIMALDKEGNVCLWNESAKAMFGFSESEVVGRPSPIVPDSERDSFRNVRYAVRDGNLLRDIEARRRRKDGTMLDVSISAAPVRNADNNVTGLMAVFADISGRKRAEARLQHSVSLLQATLDATADGILALDLQGRIMGFNQRLADMWQIPKEVLETGDTDTVVRMATDQLRDPEHFLDKIRRYMAGEELGSWDLLRFKDGRLFERYSHVQTIHGRAVGYVFSYRDITRRVQLEDQLRQAQKMEAIGQLAGGIAHDFNNILNVIVGYSALIQSQTSPQDPLYTHSEQVLKAAERAAALTRQLLVFSRRQVLELHVLDLNAVIGGLGKMLPRIIGEDIGLELRQSPELGNVKADAGQIEQVIMNLVVNARDAMPNGGTLIITTENRTLDPSDTRAQVTPPGDYVVISVSDTGSGMTSEVQARIFEPFFTTKEAGKGTGLGLATVYGIVRQLGGHIEVESDVGHGSIFHVFLPRVHSAAEQKAAEEAPDNATRGTETVLLAEDEASLRELIAQILQARGYRVITARDGSEAIRYASHYEGQIDIVITDVVMPGMRGWELAERMTQLRPGVRILYISGYADDKLTDRAQISANAAFLQKPFTPDALVHKVRELLSARQQT